MAVSTIEDQSATRRRSDRLVGTSKAVQRAVEQVAVAGRGHFPVFIHGEDGVDKELVARLTHTQSEWATNGFFSLDASIMPPSLLGRELFGCESGAIPSLPDEYDGAFARTRLGTVLIERVDSIPKDLQQSLASALKTKQYRRIGGPDVIPLECRLMTASASSLDELASEGKLVPELVEQLRVLEIRIPPLRERKEDIIPTAAHLLSQGRAEIERETGRPCAVRGLSREALERLRSHSWPGNERELREQIMAALRLSRSEELGPEDLMLSWDQSEDIPSFRDAKRAFEHEYVTRVLRICRGNISRAARIAKKDRKDFYDVMRRNAINPQDFRT
jgi:two-component system response regulator GlrR